MTTDHARSQDVAGTSPKAMLFTRSSPKLARAAAWDEWEVDKHMYDLVRAPGMQSATMYKRVSGLPQALRPDRCTHRRRDPDACREVAHVPVGGGERLGLPGALARHPVWREL
jgi:hypothetical protein